MIAHLDPTPRQGASQAPYANSSNRDHATNATGGNGKPIPAQAPTPIDATPSWLHLPNDLVDALADWTLSHIVVRKDVYGAYRPDGNQYTAHEPLTRELLIRHFRGEITIGCHTASADERCRTVAADIDAHDDNRDVRAVNEQRARTAVEVMVEHGISGFVFDSNGRGGLHVRGFFKHPIPLATAHWLGEQVNTRLQGKGLEPVEWFPKQSALTLERPYGNWLRIPGKHHKRDHWSCVFDVEGPRWLAGEAAARYLIRIVGDDPRKLLDAYKAAKPPAADDLWTVRSGRGSSRYDDGPPSEEKVRSALACLPDSWTDSYGGTRSDTGWLGVGMALHSWDQVRGLGLWHEFSARNPAKYDAAVCDEKWRTFTSDGKLTIRTIFKEAIATGWKPSRNGHTKVSSGSVSVNGDGEAAEEVEINRTDTGNSLRLVGKFGDSLRYVPAWKKWIAWDGKRWRMDDLGRVNRCAKQVARDIRKDAATPGIDPDEAKAIVKWALKSEDRRSQDAMIALAWNEPGIPIEAGDLDTQRMILNVKNGTIDMQTGELREHRREDLITKLAPVIYDKNATCPNWLATLSLVFGGDKPLIEYFQRLCGLALTGEVSEQYLPLLWGLGANGKSTVCDTMVSLLGPDYAMRAPSELLMSSPTHRHPTERAALHGKRLVIAIETDEGGRLNEAQVKELTGGDDITARRMREDFWTFKPTHKVWLCTNHRPEVHGTDHAIWRRIKLVPFNVKIEDKDADKAMPRKLRQELSGILNWCLAGCLAWQAEGRITAPEVVEEATREYRQEQDVIGAFLAEHCTQAAGLRVRSSTLYARYLKFVEGSAWKDVLSNKAFSQRLKERGFVTFASNGIHFNGLGLRLGESGF